jgi:ferric-dicitrate binding protein FerR (iron transport regulator)
MEFSAEPLGNAVARINAVRAGPPIEIDPRLSNLRVTGVFQQGSSEEIASSLAAAFGLELTRTSAGTLRLAR